ncbi:glucose-1-phosphate cytidylyltransferase [Aureimonas endophytica]|uniref:Glucose-1-phosphate cytidylyltransferase n=1 Tax=Aureimonas endophytica TaxID=2027858 RepID=A0A917E0C3_9HYPH|nr:glucose-1-phosphate cytidylyltransferase [Aureimonas endophytica]GGD87258.1 glucose-1-phosphate cytidylyltransferase [Aureimonas endophytica]
MKVALLAGGFGTRLSEETTVRPKPMAEIGGRPILWHIMKIYAHYGFNDFVVLGGYKVEYIKEYFLRYFSYASDFTIDLGTGSVDWLTSRTENWKVTVLDTGIDTLTAGRVKRAREFLGDGPFMLTYGDGVANVDINALLRFHRDHGKWCSLTAVVQPGRFGALRLSDDGAEVHGFREKGMVDGGMINGGFFVCEPQVFDVIDGDRQMWEDEPMSRMVAAGQVASYRHEGYWESMDTLRDKLTLEKRWSTGNAPWRVWND